jgi:ATP/maltotriose-dependent transcriptional regulator MalT
MIRGHIALNFGRDHAAAEADFRSALELFVAEGERWGTAFSLVSVATLDLWRGEYAAAETWFTQALMLASELGTSEDMVFFRTQLARAQWLLGKGGEAQASLDQVLRELEQFGATESRGTAHIVAGDLARLDGDLVTARSQLRLAAAAMNQQKPSPHHRAWFLTTLGQTEAADGGLEAARAHLAQAIAAGVESKDAPVLAQVLIGAADVVMCEGNPVHAAELLGASLAIRGLPDQSAVDYPRIAAAARAALGGAGYEAAHRRGRSATIETAAELAGLPAPAA